MVSCSLTDGISNLMINGMCHEEGRVLSSKNNISLQEKISNGVSASMSTDLPSKSDTSSSLSSQMCTLISQDTSSHIKCNQNVGDKSYIETPKSCIDSKEPNLVMCCDSTNNLTDVKNSIGTNLETFLDNDISGHKQISQDVRKNETSKGNSVEKSAKDNMIRLNDFSERDQKGTDSDISVNPSTLSGPVKGANISQSDVTYIVYESELNMPDIIRLIQKDLSEPYSIYTYRYFIHNWPHLCFMVSNCYGTTLV